MRAAAAALLLVAGVAGGQERPGGAGFQPSGPLPAWSARGMLDAGVAARDVGAELPGFVALPGVRAHVFMDEELEPDAVRRLARPSCTAWVRTRTNMVRESIVERLARFGAAYVQLRAPFLEAHAAQLQRAPSVGAWLSPRDLRARGLARLGGRPWAVSLFGTLKGEELDAAAAAKVAEVRWTPGPRDLTLEAWARFAQAPGARVVAWPAAEPPAACASWARGRASGPPAVRVGPLRPEALADAVAACPLVTRVEVAVTAPEASLARALAASPRVELELDVGASPELARLAARLLDQLEARAAGISAEP